ncbi:hypothetical protein FB567DRAFT_110723 [Paraphoma chrysanthemicola]|uniref:Uncharacterized protein n=1 Tax=Paraphoma chrysanthemicola TaxID=798071 RepID=A0A8K0QZR3_9PLEO|nr:hypothetical protein FB567DRAFT_110723 [Paraphoma chrysanthemicola]
MLGIYSMCTVWLTIECGAGSSLSCLLYRFHNMQTKLIVHVVAQALLLQTTLHGTSDMLVLCSISHAQITFRILAKDHQSDRFAGQAGCEANIAQRGYSAASINVGIFSRNHREH